jgi:hypothetical protein
MCHHTLQLQETAGTEAFQCVRGSTPHWRTVLFAANSATASMRCDSEMRCDSGAVDSMRLLKTCSPVEKFQSAKVPSMPLRQLHD